MAEEVERGLGVNPNSWLFVAQNQRGLTDMFVTTKCLSETLKFIKSHAIFICFSLVLVSPLSKSYIVETPKRMDKS